MRRLFHFILSHSIFIAICAAALSFQTGQLIGIAVDGFLLGFIFFAVLVGYNGYWLVSRYSFSGTHTIHTLIEAGRYSFILLVLAFGGMLFCFTQLEWVFSNLVLSGILFALYLLPILPFKELEWIRRIGFMKTVLLAFTWAILTTLVPLQVPIWSMGSLASLIFIGRFFFMLLLCIIFDKRDAAVDKIRGLQSLATAFNPIVLHFLIAFIFLGYCSIHYFIKGYGVGNAQVISLEVIGLVTLLVYVFSLQKRGYFFYYFGVDGLMFFSALLTWLAGKLVF